MTIKKLNFLQGYDNLAVLKKNDNYFIEIGYYKEPIPIIEIIFSDYVFEKISGKTYPTKCEIFLRLDSKLHERISSYIKMSNKDSILIELQEYILQILNL